MENKWFENRGLKALEYQMDIINNKLPNSLKDSKFPTILAACPSAGKTLISLSFIEDYLKVNPIHRVLILTHGTTVLRTQYHDELIKYKPGYTFEMLETSKTLKNSNSQVIVTLPQTIIREKNLPHFDLLIVDEAHQFYFADMVQNIIMKVKPQYQILLTGTPSPFILRKYPIIPITVNKLLEYDMVENLLVELASSSYDFNLKDYNEDNDLKDSVIFEEYNTSNTLDVVLEKIINRLKFVYKNDPEKFLEINNNCGWVLPLEELQKTMIACKSQEQAKQVAEYFRNKNINYALSISDTDEESLEIQRFKKDKNCLILIVVGRGILGFNLRELENVIDLTCSCNVNRIFQLMCRVIRKHPNNKPKLFIKIVPNSLNEYFQSVMTLVLCLTDEKYYTVFNGKNLSELKIPVRLEPNNNSKTKKKKKNNIHLIEYEGIPVISLFKEILHDDNHLKTFAYVTVNEIKNKLFNTKQKGYWTKELCHEESLKYNSRKSFQKGCRSAYNAALRNGWLDEICSHMISKEKKQKGHWTKNKCQEEALKYNTRKSFQEGCPGAYSAAKKNKWLDEICSHMYNFIWTKNECHEEALKYNTIKSFREGCETAYRAAKRNRWLTQICSHMSFICKKKWTKIRCRKEALKYNSRKSFKKGCRSAYDTALRNGWLDEICSHYDKLDKDLTSSNKSISSQLLCN